MTLYSYNARDQIINPRQVTNLKQYQGTDQSSVYQDTVMTYDGYGRLSSRRLPQQSSSTIYSYYADDLVQSVQDVRGAVARCSYNARHLLTGLNYSAPTGITATSPVSYGYDEVGNRTSMTDGMVISIYYYDQLSRMDREDRTFTGVTGPFRPCYAYNMACRFNFPLSSISYTYDPIGLTTDIDGTAIETVSTLASNIRYRAWRTLKSLSYGNARPRSTTYNSRIQPTHFEIPGMMASYYQYDVDGHVSAANNPSDARFNRYYSYDAVGRLTHGRIAEEGPYDQSYSYDVWGNLTINKGDTFTWGRAVEMSERLDT
jgi:hypothetical protein